MRIVNIPLFSVINSHIIDYPTPSNFNYLYNFGSTAGAVCLVTQLVTGILLAMHYSSHVDIAFNYIEHLVRDVNSGWALKYVHANGASMFFAIVFIHIARGLYFKSYRKSILWLTGFIIFVLMMGTAFLGYVLPWGQMSFWAATVITSFASSIPYCGENVVRWLWGGFSVDNSTLQRFFSLHYLLPFIITAFVISHIAVLHTTGSTNPLGICSHLDKISFYPYFLVKDVLGWFITILIFSYFIFFNPNILGHPDNYIRANPLVTPAHIVPEWYFLVYYAILRSIPDKIWGLIAFVCGIVMLLVLPLLPKNWLKTSKFDALAQILFFIFIFNVFILTWIGSQLVEDPYLFIGQLATFFFFSYFVGIAIFISYFDFTNLIILQKKDNINIKY